MMIALRELEGRVDIAYYLTRAPLYNSETLMLMHSFALALSELHEAGDLWDHCETGVIVLPDFTIKIAGTLSERNKRLKVGDVDINRSVAPPEFIDRGLHNERSDIFAWGIVAYELVTGECPLKGESIAELIEAGLACNFTPIRDIRSDFPERLCSVISKSIMKDPADRYASMKDLIRDLGFS